MAKVSPNQLLLPSVLDRLILDDPSAGASSSRGQYLRQLKESVRRDLESLLNTRWRCVDWPKHLTELDVSLVSYGLPDMTGMHFGSPESQEEFRRLVESCVRNFETRLQGATVLIVKGRDPLERTLRLRIKASLRVQPSPEEVTYDSILEPLTGSVAVTGGAR